MEKPSDLKYDFVLVSFPFEDFQTVKVRPALCITSAVGEHDHVILAFISSKLPETPLETDLIIFHESSIGKKSGLIVDSVIRFHKIIAIPKSLIKRRLGKMEKKGIDLVKMKIKALFEI